MNFFSPMDKIKEKRNTTGCVKLVEPNYGRIVTLEITTEEPILVEYTKNILTTINGYNGVKVVVDGKKVTYTWPSSAQAEAFRQTWK